MTNIMENTMYKISAHSLICLITFLKSTCDHKALFNFFEWVNDAKCQSDYNDVLFTLLSIRPSKLPICQTVFQHTWMFAPQVGSPPPLCWVLRLYSPRSHQMTLVILPVT